MSSADSSGNQSEAQNRASVSDLRLEYRSPRDEPVKAGFFRVMVAVFFGTLTVFCALMAILFLVMSVVLICSGKSDERIGGILGALPASLAVAFATRVMYQIARRQLVRRDPTSSV